MTPDPIELELMRNLFEAAADEMGITLQRVAFSANVKERRDFSCCLFDAQGSLLAQAAHIPVHLGSMGDSVRACLDQLGPLEAEDVAILNDPFAGGTHLPDITVISPIYFEGQLLAFAASRAHHADVGGKSPGSMTLSRHIDEEGLRLDPARLYSRGKLNRALMDRIRDAVRTPEERMGDLEAQIAANRVGASAFLRMIRRDGPEKVLAYGSALLNYAQFFMARAIAAIPDGEYRFEDFLDDDGAGSGPIAISAAVTIEGDRATVDLRGSADQVTGCVNCPRSVTRAAVYYCFACLLDEQVPLNGGCFRNIELLTRPGSVVDAAYPAAVVAGNTETSQRIVDAIFGALASALPERIPAASCGTMSSVALGGEGWTYYETIPGGSGAAAGHHGADAIQCHMTNTLNTPAEAIEMQYPLRVRRFERAAGTGGRGQWRGGDGAVREIEALAGCTGTILSDRRRLRPYGLNGGASGTSASDRLVLPDGKEISLESKSTLILPRGSVLRIQTPGGGGWGRSPAVGVQP